MTIQSEKNTTPFLVELMANLTGKDKAAGSFLTMCVIFVIANVYSKYQKLPQNCFNPWKNTFFEPNLVITNFESYARIKLIKVGKKF